MLDEYVRDWMDRYPLHQALDGRTRFTGSGLVKSAPGFREAYRAAAIYPDFFDKHRIRDTAAILRIGPPSLHLAVFTERFGDRVFLEFAPPMLEVLEPAFVQGTRALLAHRSIVRSFFRQIDESETATAHCSLRGVLLHRNVALSHLLRSAPASARLEARMQALADDAQGLAGIAATDRLEELLHSATTLHRTGGTYRLEPVLAERALDGSPPLVLVMVRSTASDGGPLAHLSQRERQMAELIATGADTRAIADRLAISAHTVRRHTERVFRKLGVRSRLQVALVVHKGATVRE